MKYYVLGYGAYRALSNQHLARLARLLVDLAEDRERVLYVEVDVHVRRRLVQGSGFRVQGSGFRVQGSGCRIQGSGSKV